MTKRPAEKAAHDAVQVLADVFVFAPIGFLKRANTLIPELVRDGRSAAASAKTIGAFVTPILKKQGEKVLREKIASAPVPSVVKPRSAPPRPAPVAEPAGSAEPGPAARSKPATARPAAGPTKSASPAGPQGEPFDGFDRLGAAAVVARLDELTSAQRAAVRRYELANRNRRTVLGRLDQLDASKN